MVTLVHVAGVEAYNVDHGNQQNFLETQLKGLESLDLDNRMMVERGILGIERDAAEIE